jgi:hypothetical protein
MHSGTAHGHFYFQASKLMIMLIQGDLKRYFVFFFLRKSTVHPQDAVLKYRYLGKEQRALRDSLIRFVNLAFF